MMQEKITQNGERQINYRVLGTGQTVMLVHGFGEDGGIWSPFADGLASDYKLIMPDLPGSGKSVADIQGVTMEDLAEDLRAVLDAENTTVCSMIGHSMGGYITLAFAEKYTARLDKFGLFHSSAFADNDEKKEARRKNIRFISKHGSRLFQEQSLPKLFSEISSSKNASLISDTVERFSNIPPESLINYTEAMMNRPDRTDVLKQFQKPVLFLMGEHDTAVPLEHGLQQCSLPEFSYIYISTQSGHMGMLEDPAFCLKAITEFLAGQ